MYYYEVWVNSLGYHSKDNLTYQSSRKLKIGAVVNTELKKEIVNAIIVKNVTKPHFKTKKIEESYTKIPLIPIHLINLAKWMMNYYPSNIGAVSRLILPVRISGDIVDSFKSLSEKLMTDTPDKIIKIKQDLTKDQFIALQRMSRNDTYLLHGITGSGKTRIYIELLRKTLANKQSAILLVPEIGLMGQLSSVLAEYFNEGTVVEWDSRQSSKTKNLKWLKMASSRTPLIIIGPRSALFSPLKNLGLIIIDECHETSYKQESAPRYETVRVASYLSNLLKIKLVLGSATPSLVDYFLAKSKDKTIIFMPNKAIENNQEKKNIKLIDLKDKSQFIRSKYLSEPLIKSMEKSLSKNEQILLYLNRRGTSRVVFCTSCGWQSTCPHCDIPLTYHSDLHKLICHSCDYKSAAPTYCPVCRNSDVIYKSIGTKAVVDEITRLFPKAKYARFDSDNKKIDRMENNYDSLVDGNIDIIIGTQIVAKSLDLPKLSTLGVLIADTSLSLPDFSSSERTFQLLNQVIGRVGRGHINTTNAIIQTYNPDNELIKFALNDNYEEFYRHEIAERQQYFFPPFCSMLKITGKAKRQLIIIEKMNDLKKQLIENNSFSDLVIEGPSPAYREKTNNLYNWQLIIKSKDRSRLLEVIDLLPKTFIFDIDPINLL